MEILKTARLGPNFTSSYKKDCIYGKKVNKLCFAICNKIL